jgi:hypothetical protein
MTQFSTVLAVPDRPLGLVRQLHLMFDTLQAFIRSAYLPGRPTREGAMPRPFRSPTLTLVVILLLAPFVGAAELHLRERLLQSQRDRVTMTVTAVVDHLGFEAHVIGEDCDLHVPLRSRDIRVPFIAGLKNACSMKPAGTSRAFWSEQLYDETHGRAVSVTGVFRIWLEHPPTGTVAQRETERVPVVPALEP